MIGCGIFFVDLDGNHDLLFRRLWLLTLMVGVGLGLPLPSVTSRLPFSSLSQNSEPSSSSELCRRVDISLRMLKLGRDNMVKCHSSWG